MFTIYFYIKSIFLRYFFRLTVKLLDSARKVYKPRGVRPIIKIAQSPFSPLPFLSFFVSASSLRF